MPPRVLIPPPPLLQGPDTPLPILFPREAGCRRCKLWEDCGTNGQVCVPTERVNTHNPDRAIIVCVRNPGGMENIHGRPLVGRSGHTLRNVYLGSTTPTLLDLGTVYLVNAVRCHSYRDRPPNKTQARLCAPYTLRDFASILPHHAETHVLCCGTEAATYLFGVTKMQDALRSQGQYRTLLPYNPPKPKKGAPPLSPELEVPDPSSFPPFRVWFTYHPAFLERRRSPSHIRSVVEHLDMMVGTITGRIDPDTPTVLDTPIPITEPLP